MKYGTPRQTGFTLVEMAIVLVIVGLLIGGVLKGQALMDNGQVKALGSEFRAVSTMVNAYRDLYKSLPGDDPRAQTDLGSSAVQATAATAGNGGIDTGTWVGINGTPVAGNETSLFWQHVRIAGLASGNKNIGTATNAVGGALGITSTTDRPRSQTSMSSTYVICSGAIPGKLARALDVMMDDGDATTGQMFAVAESGGPVVTSSTAFSAYSDDNKYSVCLAQ